MGVTGGTPIGFDVGAKEAGGTLRGLDLVSSLSLDAHTSLATLFCGFILHMHLLQHSAEVILVVLLTSLRKA